MKAKKIIITGGTGFIGQALARFFGKENHVILLSRESVHATNNNYGGKLLMPADGYNITYWTWDGKTVEKHWANELEGADIVINLAGKSVNCRYTEKNKEEIIQSRVLATETIGEAIRRCTVPPKVWINAASATIYRNEYVRANDEYNGVISDWKNDNMPYSLLDRIRFFMKKTWRRLFQSDQPEKLMELDKDFSVKVCKAWEGSFFNQRTAFTRKVALRAAITLGENGVMVPYFNLLKFGLGGRQGDGKQMYSWIHIEDLSRAIEWIYDHKEMEGIYDCAAPNPVSNDEFMAVLRKQTGYKYGLPAYDWMLELGAALIGTETELILKSRWVVPAKLQETGFEFSYPTLPEAVKEIVDKTPRNRYRWVS